MRTCLSRAPPFSRAGSRENLRISPPPPRLRYVAHPHQGDKWCIYPTYDFTHCVVDALEHVDYSICTLEFETRRESYYWLLEAIGAFRPKVYEMSRVNVSYIVLSKRKLIKLVNVGFVRGWDDPRMPTISGMRRRGYPPAAINRFCTEIGVTRNAKLIEYEKLSGCVRRELDPIAPRISAARGALARALSLRLPQKAPRALCCAENVLPPAPIASRC